MSVDELKEFIDFLYSEARGIQEYGHSLHVNKEDREELLEIVKVITSNLERFDEIIVESYGL